MTTTTYTVRGLDSQLRTFDGQLLGFGTSQMDSHIHPPGQLPEGLRCSGCRWTETRIWWSATDSSYVVGVKGHSSLPGEQHRYKSWWATSADGVLDVLLTTPPPRRALLFPVGYRELPTANYDALLEAAEDDRDLSEVLLAWEQNDKSVSA